MKIGIIGCGKMGSRIARRLKKHEIILFNKSIEKSTALAKEIHAKAANELDEVLSFSEVLFLCIKPQDLETISSQLRGKLDKICVISLLAGTSIDTLKRALGEAYYLRCMPNIALSHGEAMIGISHLNNFPLELEKKVESLMPSFGTHLWLQEEMLDRFAPLAASGPAFFFTLFEAMVEAGLILGFSKEESSQILHQTIKGSLTLLKKSKKHPAELKWEVASPAGMTLAGLKTLEDEGLRAGIINAFLAAYERSQDL